LWRVSDRSPHATVLPRLPGAFSRPKHLLALRRGPEAGDVSHRRGLPMSRRRAASPARRKVQAGRNPGLPGASCLFDTPRKRLAASQPVAGFARLRAPSALAPQGQGAPACPPGLREPGQASSSDTARRRQAGKYPAAAAGYVAKEKEEQEDGGTHQSPIKSLTMLALKRVGLPATLFRRSSSTKLERT